MEQNNTESLVKMSNELVRSKLFPSSVYGMRILVQFAKALHPKDEEFHQYTFHRSVIFDSEDERGGETSRLLEECTDDIMGKVLTRRNGSSWKKCNLFFDLEYDSKTGMIIGQLHPHVKDLFLRIKKFFLYVDEREFNSLKNVYSQRLYMYLLSYKSVARHTMTLTDLHDFLKSPKSYRSNYNNFKKKVLDVVEKEINENTSFKFKYIEDKQGGKRVKALQFGFSKGIIGIIETENAQLNQEKMHAENMKIFKKFQACYAKKKGHCNKETLGKKYCSECRKFYGTPQNLPM